MKNLSDEIIKKAEFMGRGIIDYPHLEIKPVKEAIKRLKARIGKEICGELTNETSIKKAYLISEDLINDINKIFGEELI